MLRIFARNLEKGVIHNEKREESHGTAKKLMSQEHLNYESWLVVKDTPTEMQIIHRNTGEIRTISKAF